MNEIKTEVNRIGAFPRGRSRIAILSRPVRGNASRLEETVEARKIAVYNCFVNVFTISYENDEICLIRSRR
jgi:hypothetical protein